MGIFLTSYANNMGKKATQRSTIINVHLLHAIIYSTKTAQECTLHGKMLRRRYDTASCLYQF